MEEVGNRTKQSRGYDWRVNRQHVSICLHIFPDTRAHQFHHEASAPKVERRAPDDIGEEVIDMRDDLLDAKASVTWAVPTCHPLKSGSTLGSILMSKCVS